MSLSAAEAKWWKTGTIYHIYMRSFCDASGDGIGDLKGLLSKLDYLADRTQGLGVNALWLSPVFPSPDADFGYDIADYTSIHPQYGTLDDFKAVLRACHDRGLRVILDIAFNHTSSAHPWFVASRASTNNPKRDWYVWHKGDKPPNNWASRFGGSAWTRDPLTDEFYLHSFLKEQPDLNWRNPAVKQAVFEVMRFWFELGVDGFRLDVFNYYFKDRQLRSNPKRRSLRGLFYKYDGQRHVHDKDLEDLYPLAVEMRKFAESFGDKLLLAEVDSEQGRHVATKCLGTQGDGLHLAFNFEFMNGKFDAQTFRKKVIRWERELPRKAWPTYVLGNHDVARALTRFGNKPERAKLLAALLLYLRGTPVLYYGDELGLPEAKLSFNQIQDPAGKFAWPFYRGRDGSRTPMPWNALPQSGFMPEHGSHSAAAAEKPLATLPWLPIPFVHRQANVEASLKNKDSLLNHYRNLLSIRDEHKALQLGELRFFKQHNPHLLVFTRTYGSECILVALNFSHRKAQALLWQSFALVDLLNHHHFITKTLHLAPLEAAVLKVEG